VKGWAGRGTADKYLNELESMGLVERGSAYQVGKFSKSLKLAWDYKTRGEAVIYNGRSIDTFEGTLKQIFTPGDLKSLLRASGADKSNAKRMVRGIYDTSHGGGKKVQHI